MQGDQLLDRPMPRIKRNDEPTKIDRGVLQEARIVAAYRNVPLAEYLSKILGPIVHGHLEEHQRAGVEPKPRRRARRDAEPPDAD